MIAQYRPEIARLAEQTVVSLKECETRLELLRNDLATLCGVVGHPAAAQLALTPARLLGPGLGSFGAGPTQQQPSPSAYGSLSPWGSSWGSPWSNPVSAPFPAPLPSPFPAPFSVPYGVPSG
ncbi:MAG: hypothetical protein LC624_10360, partial [Halobacteriales archaeon]|nr:hypothetical protein [Halobacteriales archaeon]